MEEENEDLIWVPTTEEKKKKKGMPGLSLEILADSGTTIGGGNLGVATQRAQPDIYYINPISLCNFCYKVISRILVARIRPLLERMMDETQVAFIPNRNIAENILLAQEEWCTLSHLLKRKMVI